MTCALGVLYLEEELDEEAVEDMVVDIRDKSSL